MPWLLRDGWFKFFKLMDNDASGRIQYSELVAGVREQLGVTASEMPEAQLQVMIPPPTPTAAHNRSFGWCALIPDLTQWFAPLPSPASSHPLQGLWKALDADTSGYISAGEFLRFVRRGHEALPEHEASNWTLTQVLLPPHTLTLLHPTSTS